MEQSKKRKRILILAIAAVILTGVVIGGILLYRSFSSRQLEGCRVLEDFLRREETELSVSVSAGLAGESVSGDFSLFRKQTAEGAFFGGGWEGITLYLKDNIFYLPEGQAFRLSARLPQGEKLLEQARLVLSTARVTRETAGERTVFRAEAAVQEAKTILALLSPETAEKMSVIDSLTVTLWEKGGTLDAMTLDAAGSDGTNPYRITVTLTVLAPGTLETEIPAAVQAAAREPGDCVTLRWDPDTLPLLRGALSLAAKKDFQAALTVGLDCGVLSTSDTLDLRYSAADGIGRLSGSHLELYFSGRKLCTAGGYSLTEYEEISPERVAGVALALLMDGRVAAQRSEDDGLYTMPLTEEELSTLAGAISAQAAGVQLTLSDGSVEARVTGNRLTDLTFRCTGSVPFLTTTLSAGVTLTLTPSESPRPLPIPDAVRQALEPDRT